jgi:hypothetical protein
LFGRCLVERVRADEQRLRAESADKTRRRILDAVYARLREAHGAGQHRPLRPVMAHFAQRLADQGTLRPDVAVDHATDLLSLLTSFDVLYTGRELSVDRSRMR